MEKTKEATFTLEVLLFNIQIFVYCTLGLMGPCRKKNIYILEITSVIYEDFQYMNQWMIQCHLLSISEYFQHRIFFSIYFCWSTASSAFFSEIRGGPLEKHTVLKDFVGLTGEGLRIEKFFWSIEEPGATRNRYRTSGRCKGAGNCIWLSYLHKLNAQLLLSSNVLDVTHTSVTFN